MTKEEYIYSASNDWKQYSSKLRPNLDQVYLVPKDCSLQVVDGGNRKSHIWNGMDALCQKYSKHNEIIHLYKIQWMDSDSISQMIHHDLICKNCIKIHELEYDDVMVHLGVSDE